MLLLVYLNILGHQHSSLNSDATFLGVALSVELAQVALQHIVLLSVKVFSLYIFASATLQHLQLLSNQVGIGLNLIIVDLVLAVQLNLKLRSHSNIEDEGIRSILLNVNGHLLL